MSMIRKDDLWERLAAFSKWQGKSSLVTGETRVKLGRAAYVIV